MREELALKNRDIKEYSNKARGQNVCIETLRKEFYEPRGLDHEKGIIVSSPGMGAQLMEIACFSGAGMQTLSSLR